MINGVVLKLFMLQFVTRKRLKYGMCDRVEPPSPSLRTSLLLINCCHNFWLLIQTLDF